MAKKRVRYLTILPNVSITFFSQKKETNNWMVGFEAHGSKSRSLGLKIGFFVLLFYNDHLPADNLLKWRIIPPKNFAKSTR